MSFTRDPNETFDKIYSGLERCCSSLKHAVRASETLKDMEQKYWKSFIDVGSFLILHLQIILIVPEPRRAGPQRLRYVYLPLQVNPILIETLKAMDHLRCFCFNFPVCF